MRQPPAGEVSELTLTGHDHGFFEENWLKSWTANDHWRRRSGDLFSLDGSIRWG